MGGGGAAEGGSEPGVAAGEGGGVAHPHRSHERTVRHVTRDKQRRTFRHVFRRIFGGRGCNGK